jgi:HNH endonuclease
LPDVQKGVCLHRQKPLSRQTQVDHFVPWSRHPAGLGHNFVLAHDKCNNARSDFLAAENHLAAWVERNREHQVELQARLVEAALPCDLTATVRVAKWVYQQAEKANGPVWAVEKVLRRLSADWSKCFAA